MERVQEEVGIRALHRRVVDVHGASVLRDPDVPYRPHLPALRSLFRSLDLLSETFTGRRIGHSVLPQPLISQRKYGTGFG